METFCKVFDVPNLRTTFLTLTFKIKSTNFDKLHVQELKPETIGDNGGNQ